MTPLTCESAGDVPRELAATSSLRLPLFKEMLTDIQVKRIAQMIAIKDLSAESPE
jgi:hypothetical protein